MPGSGDASPRLASGCLPDRPDSRDYPFPFEDLPPGDHFTGGADTQVDLSTAKIDLSTAKEMPEVWDQKLEISSCVPHAVAAAWVFAARRSGKPAVTPSRLFIWYEARMTEYSTDPGNKPVRLRDTLNVLSNIGAPTEELWPYDTTQLAVPPPRWVYETELHKATNYFTLNKHEPIKLETLKAVLNGGLPICFAFQYFPAFESDEVRSTGELAMPTATEQAQFLGYHAALLVGYDDATHLFKVRNSFGSDWGQQGYFTMPYEYVCSPLGGEWNPFWTLSEYELASRFRNL